MALLKKFEITTAYNDIYDITESVKETAFLNLTGPGTGNIM
jgi:hypothetical protein